MIGSLKIATLFGIPIRVHWSFLLIALVMIPDPFLLVALFGLVLLHELGHSLVARHFGIRVLDITFWPLGGMARMSSIPEQPKVEGLVAVAGPLVNFVLAGIGAGILVASWALLGERPRALRTIEETGIVFLFCNLALGTFNLLPAFPMDGGRILRAFLARRRDWVAATERAVTVSRVVSAAMVALPLVLFFTVRPLASTFALLPVIGIYVYFVGTQELFAVRLRHGRFPFGPGVFAAGDPPRPPRAEAEWTARPAPDPASPPPDAGEARRPADWDGLAPGRGFDEERIRALERYRGRLRHYRDEE
ncbi:MAG: site-2 protease family protein [Planctomycetota bacterium]